MAGDKREFFKFKALQIQNMITRCKGLPLKIHHNEGNKQHVEYQKDIMSSQSTVISAMTANTYQGTITNDNMESIAMESTTMESTTTKSSVTTKPSPLWVPSTEQNVWVRHFQNGLVGDVVALLSITMAAKQGVVSIIAWCANKWLLDSLSNFFS